MIIFTAHLIIFYREFDDLLQLGELCEQFKTARAERRRGRRPKGKPKPDTKIMAWGPLGGQGVEGIVKSEELTAIGTKYNKSAAQVALRWLTQRGIVAIPKSTHKERMAQNIDIFDFTLTDDDMAQIGKMNQHDSGTINFNDPKFVKYLIENYG